MRESRGGERERKRGRAVKGGISSEEYLFSVQYFYLQLSLVPFSLKALFYLSQRVNFQPFSVEVGGVLVYLGVVTGRVGKESEI